MKGIVLAGGYSERMGRTKGLIEYRGKSFVENAYDKLSVFLDEVFVSVRTDQLDEFNFLSEKSIRLLIDEKQNIGPSAAFLRAREKFPEEDWLVFACDFALAKTEDIEKLILIADAEPSKDVICFENEEKILEPLFAIWRKRALDFFAEEIEKKKIGPQEILKKLNFEPIHPFDPEALRNFNEPKDFAYLMRSV